MVPGQKSLTGAGAAVDASEHDFAHGSFELALGRGKGFVELRAFLEGGVIKRFALGNGSGGFAAFTSHSIDFKGDASCAANGQWNLSFDFSHLHTLYVFLGARIQHAPE